MPSRPRARRVSTGLVAIALAAPAAPWARAGEAPTGMVRVPAGQFSMGAEGGKAEPNESPVREIALRAYFLDATEVPVGAYRACVERGACAKPTVESTSCTYDRGDPLLAMNCVSWDEADGFCRAHEKRLPTEAEWERAARGRGSAPYPWGSEAPDCDRAVILRGDGTSESCGRGGPLRVGGRKKGRSPYGALDMMGNVEEWVADFYDDRYPQAAGVVADPKGPAVGFSHVLRGGGWQSPRVASRVTARSWGSLEERGTNVGFRCAKDG